MKVIVIVLGLHHDATRSIVQYVLSISKRTSPEGRTLTANTLPRLLVVDDEFHVRETVSTWFYQRGFHVCTAENGAIAVDLCAAEPFDVVLIDLEMPVMNGAEAIKAIRAKTPNQRIVVFSGFSTDIRSVTDLGVNRILRKPLSLHELEQEVRDCLGE